MDIRASGDDLWSAAIQTLGHELTSQIDFAQDSKEKTLDEVLAVTEQARKRSVGKSWSFKRKNGEVVFVRDLLAKAAKWVNHFKDVGDIAVQYDPAHAALPWAGVRFLLNVAVGDLNTYNSVLERTVDIEETICRNAIIERLLKDFQSQTAEKLNRALVELYASILAYLAKAKSYYEQNSLKRVLKHGVLASSDLESAFTAISEAQKHVDRCATNFGLSVTINIDKILCLHHKDQLESHAELKRMLKDFDAPIKRWDEALHNITDQLHRERRNGILRWMSDEPYEKHHVQARSEVLEGTGKWLLHDPTFLRWKNESASSILWLHGIPGSGKSKLTSIVVEDALEASQQKQAPAPAYFYCSRNTAEPNRSDPSKIVTSIARQLSTPETGGPLLDAAIEVYKRREEKAFASGPLRLDESKELTLKLLKRYEDATMTIVIDALDECNPATRGDLLDALEDLLKTSPCLLKIFVSSRTDQDIVYKLDNYPNLDLDSNRNSEDINLFVRSETKRLIDKGSLLRFSTEREKIHNKVVDELISGAQGMFRWVSLQLQALCQLTTDVAILERLGRLPKTLSELYQEILAKIENLDADADRQFAQSALSWLLCAQEQLSSDVFLAAVSVAKDGSAPSISRDQLLHLCCNLVIFDSTTDAFRFSHLSVREFLENQGTYQPASANALVAEACLYNLNRMAPKVPPQSPLLTYSCLFWAKHSRAAARERQTRLNEALVKFLSTEQYSSCFYSWHRMAEKYLDSRAVHRGDLLKLRVAMSYVPRVLLVICVYDLFGVLSPGQWRQLAQNRPRNKHGETHQEVAVRYGNGGILEWHFNNGIPFEVNEKVLERAAGNIESGKEILALLFDKRGDEIQITEGVVEAAAGNIISGKEILALLLDKRGDEIQITESVVKAAAGNIISGKEILALLLDKRGDEIQITEGVVEAAAGNSRSGKEILALLLDKCGAKIQITESVVKAIARSANLTIFQQLLDKRGDEIQITESVVKAAAGNIISGKEILALLLDKRGDEIQITEGVVEAAAENSRSGKEILALLLDKRGDEIQITESVVKAAAGDIISGKEILALLLDKRGDEIQITEGVVEAAARNPRRSKEILALLLDKCGAKIQITEGVVEAIARSANLTIFQQLLDKRGDEIQITESVVKAAAENFGSGKKILALLLDKRGAKIQITEGVVEAIARSANLTIFQQLLDKRGDEIQITESVVKAAARNFESGKKILALLLDKCGDEIQITEGVVEAIARNSGSGKEILALLLDKCGAKIQITESVVKAIARSANLTIFQQLLDKRGDEIQITEGVVEAATRNSRSGKEILALLLDKRGAKIQITESVVKAIARSANLTIFQQLLDKRGDEIQITEGVVEAATRNSRSGKEILALLLDKRGDEIQITESVVKAAAGNSGSGKEILALLLDKRGDEIQITEGVVEAAAGNSRSSKEILALLLDKRGDEIQITEGVVKAAAETWTCARVLGLLMKTRKSDTIAAITDRVCFAAASCGRLDSLHYLCQHLPRAKIDPCWDSIACFYQAAKSGDVYQLNQLLHEQISFDIKDSEGRTPLWIAAFHRQTDVVRILVRGRHADVNSLSASGQSPIFWPSAYGYEDIIKILVSAGAKSYFIDADGRTAISMARQHGHEKIVRILDSQSAQHREIASVGQKLRWRRLILGIGLILLGLIFSTFCI
ncbi:hypothetical protein FPOA_14076 [Fusarium poae]|uniref:NACHT domain-containing protein n=1 Tax=Fusarium poae TaxID=36050 RepID=A0A1B8A3K3_FUSPO|nr:hypothetical protein FPOA_14076 [Fusarium poae]